MKMILLVLGLFLLIPLSANADVIDINGETYATEDCIIVHCADGEYRELMSLPIRDVSYIVERDEIYPVTMNGKQYINLTTLSESLIAEGRSVYVIPKTKRKRVITRVCNATVREYVYNGSEYEMKRNPTSRCYIQGAIGKTENLIGVFQSSSLSSLDKIRNVIYAFGY